MESSWSSTLPSSFLSESLFPVYPIREVVPSPLQEVISPVMGRSSGLFSAIVFIDSTVQDYQQLERAIAPGTAVYILDPMQDAISQITQTLLQYSEISSVHVISHGRAGSLQLGQTTLGLDSLTHYADQLRSWSTALTEDADILLYGCEIGAGEWGAAFVQQFAQLTGADIAASNNVTGSAALGGDWHLEVNTGDIAASLVASLTALSQYQYILPTQVISVSGSTQGNGDSWAVNSDATTWSFSAANSTGQTISDDGRYVLFTSQATNLSGADSNGQDDIFLFDRVANSTILVSARYNAASDDNDETATGSGRSFNPVMSADGRYVAFTSAATDLVASDGNGSIQDVFLWDRVTRQTTLISRSNTGQEGLGNSFGPSISRDGKRVVFTTAGNLLRNNDYFNQVFVYEWTSSSTSGSIRQVSVNNAGVSGNDQSALDYPALISGNGRYVVFQSHANNLTGLTDANGGDDVFVRDLVDNETILVSVNTSLTGTGNQGAYRATISENGQYIAFISNATDLVNGGSNGGRHAYVRDLVNGTTQLVSQSTAGEQAFSWQQTSYVTLSGDGRFAVFVNAADNLVANDTNDVRDIFVRDLTLNTTSLVSGTPGNVPGNDASDSQAEMMPVISYDGRYIAFASSASNLVGNDNNGARDVFLRDRAAGTTTLISQNWSGTASGQGSSNFAGMNRDGSAIVFTSAAPDLVATDTNGRLDVFWVGLANQPPVATNDSFGTNEDTVLTNNVLTNDSDLENNLPLTVSLVSGPTQGSLSLNANGTFSYTPGSNYSGTDTFTYSVSDSLGATSGLASVVLSVTATNDAPVAVNDSFGTNEDTVLTNNVLTNDSDLENNLPLTVSLVSGPTQGSLSLNANGMFSYTPGSNYSGTDTFTYSVSDSLGATSGLASVVLSVTATNDAPVAVNESYTFSNTASLSVTAPGVLSNDTDVDTPLANLSASVANLPNSGTLTFNPNGSFTYTPNAGFTGSDRFIYQVSDGGTISNLGTVSLSVTSSGSGTITGTLNSQPIAVTDTFSGSEDLVMNGNVLANDTDPDGNLPLTAILISAAAQGSLSLNANGTFSYTPAAEMNGTDSFTYRARDAMGSTSSGTTTVFLTVNPVNDAPSFIVGANQIVSAGAGVQTIAGWASGFNPGPANEAAQTVASYQIVSNSNPSIFATTPSISPTGTLTYTPVATLVNTASAVVGVRVQDNGGTANGGTDLSPTQFFTITVTALPTLSLAAMSQQEGNNGTTWANFTVSLSKVSDVAVDVQYSTTDGTARVADGDYGATNGTLTFLPGELTKVIAVPITGDTQFESNETFQLNLSSAVNAQISTSTVSGTILNDDTRPTVSVNGLSRQEGNTGNTNFLFTVSLSSASYQSISVNYATADGTATKASGDYFETLGTLVFTPGETRKMVTVAVTGDRTIEQNEQFSLVLSNPVNGDLATATATATILNDDGVTTSDFNRDGQNDVVWRNYLTGENQVWLMNSTLPSSVLQLPAAPTNWVLEGVGDFNQDGHPDLVWREYNDGVTGIWYLSGASLLSVESLAVVPTNWQIEGIGDFNRDSQPDILWRETGSGYLGIWYMNGIHISQTSTLGNVGAEWVVDTVTDLNNDGQSDILWRYPTTGSTGAWLVYGTADLPFYSTVNVPSPMNPAIEIAGTGDYNRDGKIDILWRNNNTGSNLIWFMDGTTSIAQIATQSQPFGWFGV